MKVSIPASPIPLALIGCSLFLAMYLLVVMSSMMLGFEVTPSVKVLSPLGLLAILCWCASIFIGIKSILQRQANLSYCLGALISFVLLLALFYLVWLLIDGFS